jgi:hypothetical protein
VVWNSGLASQAGEGQHAHQAGHAVGGGSVDVLQAAAGGIRRTRKQSRQGQNKAADGHADVGHGQGALSVKWIDIIYNKDNQ